MKIKIQNSNPSQNSKQWSLITKIAKLFLGIIAIVSFSGLVACEDKETSCPSSEIAGNSVYCKINGMDWNAISSDSSYNLSPCTVNFSYQPGISNSLNLSATNDSLNFEIGINYKSGTLKLGNNKLINGDLWYVNDTLTGLCIYFDSLDNDYNNYVNIISIDRVKYILEGSFQFKAYNICRDTLTVNNGYFKTRYTN